MNISSIVTVSVTNCKPGHIYVRNGRGFDLKGGMTENYVNIQLTINGYHTCYWESARGAEVDFIIRRNSALIPIEVKSADNDRSALRCVLYLIFGCGTSPAGLLTGCHKNILLRPVL